MVQVNDSMYGFVGTDVVLHCSFANPLPGVKITQVTWQKATNGSKQNVAIYNPAMGVSVLAPYRERVEFLRPSFTDGTIRLSRLELDDEGVYICEFATFPAGNRESQLNLTVMGKRARALSPCLRRGLGPGLGHPRRVPPWPRTLSLGRQAPSGPGTAPPVPSSQAVQSWGGRGLAADRAEDQDSGRSPAWGLCG